MRQRVLGSLFELVLSLKDFLVLLWYLAIPQILQPNAFEDTAEPHRHLPVHRLTVSQFRARTNTCTAQHKQLSTPLRGSRSRLCAQAPPWSAMPVPSRVYKKQVRKRASPSQCAAFSPAGLCRGPPEGTPLRRCHPGPASGTCRWTACACGGPLGPGPAQA